MTAKTRLVDAVKAVVDLTGVITKITSGNHDLQGLRDSAVACPASNLSAAVGAAGALTGAYYYTQTYVLIDGTETEPWSGTATVVNPSAQKVELTSIPVSPSALVAKRRIYRSVATPTDPKDYRFLVEIADNTTTTYSDNTVDGSLGDPVNWAGTHAGIIITQQNTVIQGLGSASQCLAIGNSAKAGYATTSIGFSAGAATTTGRRNTQVGTYANTSITTGYENCAYGVHSGQSLTTGRANTFNGYQSGYYNITGNYNTGFGKQAIYGTVSGIGTGNTALGYRALSDINTADYCIAIGFSAGKYANASRQVFIDGADRSNIANCQNIGLIYGKHESTAIAQVLHLNAPTRIGPPSVTVATLPAAAAGYTGFRAFVTDANATTFASVVAGGGANGVPVYCDGTNWRIG